MFEMYSSSFPSMIIRISSLVCVQFRQKIFPNKILLDPIWHLATTITCQNDCHGECDRKITISSATKTIKIYEFWSNSINDRNLTVGVWYNTMCKQYTISFPSKNSTAPNWKLNNIIHNWPLQTYHQLKVLV